METWLLALRVVVGLLLVGRGARKLFGWFGGGGLTAAAWFFRSVRYRSPRLMARLAGGVELVGGSAFAVGLGIPLAAAAVTATMLNAAVGVHTRNRRLGIAGGYSYPLGVALMAATLGFSGAGAVSLDAALGVSDGSVGSGVLAVALGLMVGAGGLLSRAPRRPAPVLAPNSRQSRGAGFPPHQNGAGRPTVPRPRLAALDQEGDAWQRP